MVKKNKCPIKKELIIDFDNYGGIKKAQKIKEKLENNGFNLTKTSQTGFSKFKMLYEKKC